MSGSTTLSIRLTASVRPGSWSTALATSCLPRRTRFGSVSFSTRSCSGVRGRGVSLLFTFEVAELFGATRISDAGVSHLSDNVVMLEYYRAGSEVRRSLTVLKTRGSDHSAEVREFRIGRDGMTLGDGVGAHTTADNDGSFG